LQAQAEAVRLAAAGANADQVTGPIERWHALCLLDMDSPLRKRHQEWKGRRRRDAAGRCGV
ncbi:hypothetical protein ACET4H_31490, partial [Pseudomonas aeruginosa]